MKKIIIFLFALLSLNRVINAQVNSQNPDMIIDYTPNYSMTYNKPIVRGSLPTEIVSYHEYDHRGVFSLLISGNINVINIELEHLTFVRDFEVLDNVVYFCGERRISSSDVRAIFGQFSLTTLRNHISPTIHIFELNYKNKSNAYLKKMEVYTDPNTGRDILMAVGHSFNKDVNGYHYDEKDFLAISHNGFAFFRYCEFNEEIYHDVIETENYIVLSGELANQGQSLAFRRIKKANYNLQYIDSIYTINLPHLEPLTYLLGEGLNGTDTFITSTYAEINNTFGTILRTYDASTMDEIQDQFIPSSSDEKTEPYELKYMNKDTTLLLQYSTSSPETKIYYIDPIPTPINNNFYVVNYEYYPNRDFYSLDKYSQNNYIAIGISARNISYAVRYISSNSVSCAIIGREDAIFNSKYGLKLSISSILTDGDIGKLYYFKPNLYIETLNTYCP